MFLLVCFLYTLSICQSNRTYSSILTPPSFSVSFVRVTFRFCVKEGGLPVLLRSDCADPSRWSVASFPFTMTVDPGM